MCVYIYTYTHTYIHGSVTVPSRAPLNRVQILGRLGKNSHISLFSLSHMRPLRQILAGNQRLRTAYPKPYTLNPLTAKP